MPAGSGRYCALVIASFLVLPPIIEFTEEHEERANAIMIKKENLFINKKAVDAFIKLVGSLKNMSAL
jgi:hypothetical protein